MPDARGDSRITPFLVGFAVGSLAAAVAGGVYYLPREWAMRREMEELQERLEGLRGLARHHIRDENEGRAEAEEAVRKLKEK